jgi:hypothetical protein
MTKVDATQRQILDRCATLNEHVKLLRDYATTPGNGWLARSELTQIQELVTQIEQLLNQLKDAEE